MGFTYRDIEDQVFTWVLTKVQVRYRRPAFYDDLLTLRTIVQRTTLVKIEHRYELLRDGVLVAEGETTLGCVDREGKVQPLPDSLRGEDEPFRRNAGGVSSRFCGGAARIRTGTYALPSSPV